MTQGCLSVDDSRAEAREAPAGMPAVPQQAQVFGSLQYTVNTQLKCGQYMGEVCEGQSEYKGKQQ